MRDSELRCDQRQIRVEVEVNAFSKRGVVTTKFTFEMLSAQYILQ